MVGENSWHKGSRFWRFGMYVVLLSVVLSLYFGEAASFLAVAPVFLTGAAAKSGIGEFNKPKFDQYEYESYEEGDRTIGTDDRYEDDERG